MEQDTYDKMQLEALITEREGMIAQNHISIVNNSHIKYGMDEFISIQQQMYGLIRG